MFTSEAKFVCAAGKVRISYSTFESRSSGRKPSSMLGLDSGNACNLYSGGTLFESLPERCLDGNSSGFLLFLRKYRQINIKYAMSASL